MPRDHDLRSVIHGERVGRACVINSDLSVDPRHCFKKEGARREGGALELIRPCSERTARQLKAARHIPSYPQGAGRVMKTITARRSPGRPARRVAGAT